MTVALATDCNPGSCFTSSMPLCVALAVREMRMTTQEAVWAATAGGARALRRTDVGHLGVGARADLILLDGPSHTYLAYRPRRPRWSARSGGPASVSSSARDLAPAPAAAPIPAPGPAPPVVAILRIPPPRHRVITRCLWIGRRPAACG